MITDIARPCASTYARTTYKHADGIAVGTSSTQMRMTMRLTGNSRIGSDSSLADTMLSLLCASGPTECPDAFLATSTQTVLSATWTEQ